MSKRLRKRIRELCGLEGLERAKRRKKAQEIIDSTDLKQRLCNKVNGLSFRDIEKAMSNVLKENKPTAEEVEEEELRRVAPQKLDPVAKKDPLTLVNKKIKSKALTREEAYRLVLASDPPVEQDYSPPSFISGKHEMWSQEEVQAIVIGNYNHTHFQRRKNYKKG